MRPKEFLKLVKQAGAEWMDDKAERLGAALAYYTIFAMAPLLVIAVAIAGWLFGEDAAQGEIVAELRGLVGDAGGQANQEMIRYADRPAAGTIATIISVVVLFIGAMGLFSGLQDALNTIWEVETKPGRAWWGMIKDRLLSFAMVLGTIFLLLVSLLVSTSLAAIGSLFGDWTTSSVGHVLSVTVSLAVITLLFAMIYRFLPDVHISWKDVWLGAFITALLFTAGKFLIGLYLGHSTVGSMYGAAGSLAVLLVWLYYSAQIFLFGAEFTQVYAHRHGSRVVPTDNAEFVGEQARIQQGIPHHQEQPAG